MSHNYELQISTPIVTSESGQIQARRTHEALLGGDVVTVRVEIAQPDGARVAAYFDIPLAVWRDVGRD